MAKNLNLHIAKRAKNDEFYTQLADVENELQHYSEHFRGKTVLCNCNDTEDSAFWQYFCQNFSALGLKRLIAVSYSKDRPAYRLEYAGNSAKQTAKTALKGNGDFRSEECVELLKEADIVITNPPFSLFREYMAQLMESDKKFLVIANRNAVTTKYLFPLIQQNKIWLGNGFANGNAYFAISGSADMSHYAAKVYNPSTGLVKFRNCIWLTNLDFAKRHRRWVSLKNTLLTRSLNMMSLMQ